MRKPATKPAAIGQQWKMYGLRLPTELHAALVELANEEGRTASNMLRRILEERLRERDKARAA